MIATGGPSALWYLTRGTGLVALLLLTGSVVLGVVQVRRWAPGGAPRFPIVTLHRAISLLVLALLVVHVGTAVLDSFAPIRLIDAVIPFASAYRPLWLGLGACALDLLVALIVTSLLRHRLGLRAWRAVHWLAYACWPLAIVHGWGTGSDARTGWMLGVTLGCAAAVLAAVIWRLFGGRQRGAARGLALAGCGGLMLAAGIWLVQGPLADGWARRAGTPASLLAPRTASAARTASTARRRAPAVPALQHAFSGTVSGRVRRGVSAGGARVVDLRLHVRGGASGVLRIRLSGDAAPGGGVLMRRSAVTLGPRSAPGLLRGRIDALDGTSVSALLGAAKGPAVRVRVDLNLSGDAVRGSIAGQPANGVAG